MLAKYLKELRASRVISASNAVSSLGSGWTIGQNGGIQKEFHFEDFMQASNFMSRYADYCAQVNHTPEWSNVYNKVSVRLHNREFNGVSSKEVQIGKYLDTVSKATLNQDVDEMLTFEKVTELAALEVESRLNVQNEPTSLFQIDDRKSARN